MTDKPRIECPLNRLQAGIVGGGRGVFMARCIAWPPSSTAVRCSSPRKEEHAENWKSDEAAGE